MGTEQTKLAAHFKLAKRFKLPRMVVCVCCDYYYDKSDQDFVDNSHIEENEELNLKKETSDQDFVDNSHVGENEELNLKKENNDC